MDQQQHLIERIRAGAVSETDLIRLLRDDRLLVRANALMALATSPPADEWLVVDAVKHAALDENSNVKIVGTLSQRILAAMVLSRMGSAYALDVLASVESVLSVSERSDLEYNLKFNWLGEEGR